MNQQQKHEKVLYPVVRVRTDKAGGSGTIIYSKENPDKPGEYLSFVLTNHHVVEDAIQIKAEFDSMTKRDVKKEFTQKVRVDIFDYINMSEMNSANTHTADIVAYDKSHDIAILKLDTPKKMHYVADMLSKEVISTIKLFEPIYSCGASLLHDPFANKGEITYLNEDIDNKCFWMSNSNMIFGNSGGAVFLAENGEFIGIPARVTSTQLGFGFDIITWMGFFIPISRIYEFFDEQELQFLSDDSFTYTECMAKRKVHQKKSLVDMAIEDTGTNVKSNRSKRDRSI